MIFVDPQTTFLGEVPLTIDEQMKFIELSGRTCYKSEDKITENSALKFVKTLYAHTHTAMIEMSNFVVRCDLEDKFLTETIMVASLYDTYLKYAYDASGRFFYVGGNLTAWIHAFHNFQTTGLSYMQPFIEKYREIFDLCDSGSVGHELDIEFEPVLEHKHVPYVLKRIAFKFVCDRGVSHELVRHRPASFAQESTRYVCYLKQKDVAFVKPYWYNNDALTAERQIFEQACFNAEVSYHNMRKLGMTPQAARAVLPNATKTELVMCSTPQHFEHIIKLRTAKDAHPDAQIAVKPLIEVVAQIKKQVDK